MKFSTLLLPAAAIGLACAKSACPYSTFEPEKPTDTRGVCPMLNTLANHGFLPRNGRDITENQTVTALNQALNLKNDFGEFLWNAARLSNPAPNATTFNLDHLNRHNLFEHDGSLSRQDAYFGDWSRFNATVFNWTKAYWPGDTLDVQIVAAARASRHMRSNLTNPEYSLSDLGSGFSLGENSALLSIMGDKTAQTVPKKFIEYLFENERLPCSLGWSKPEEPITIDDLARTLNAIIDATLFPPLPPPDNSFDIFNMKRKRWNLHVGYY
ncbi:Cloroperoxidase [Xylariaceae sp. FL1651]|nr:Cloroperoxidase [Xylariaceae sp. FL1651]